MVICVGCVVNVFVPGVIPLWLLLGSFGRYRAAHAARSGYPLLFVTASQCRNAATILSAGGEIIFTHITPWTPAPYNYMNRQRLI